TPTRVSDLQFDLEVAIARKSEPPPAAPGSAHGPAIGASAGGSQKPATAKAQAGSENGVPPERADDPVPPAPAPGWQIRFRPFRELLVRGNDPVRMLRELAELGALKVRIDTQALPALADINPQDCHLSWALELPGEVAEEAIRQVFEWAEGDCDLTIERAPSATPASPASAADRTIQTQTSAGAPHPRTTQDAASEPPVLAQTPAPC
ncbi:chemotaxis protein CheA, partial [mine drainage metagenome]